MTREEFLELQKEYYNAGPKLKDFYMGGTKCLPLHPKSTDKIKKEGIFLHGFTPKKKKPEDEK
jgi:hypothetical protein